MKVSEYAIKHYQFTLIIFLMIIALGVSTLLTMPRSEDPEVTFPVFSVIAVCPGTNPKNLENLIVDPIEKKITGLENIKQTSSIIKDGVAIIYVEFKYGTDINYNHQELTREVNGLRSQLPKELTSLKVEKRTASSVNIIQLALVSENAPYETLKKQAKELQQKLEKITALKDVEIEGLPEKIIRVDFDLDKLAQMHLPINVALNTIQSEMTTIPGGNIDAGHKTYNVVTTGNFNSIDEIKNTSVYTYKGNAVKLKDIANVQYDFNPRDYITRLNGHRCIFITAGQKQGCNISFTQKLYNPIISKFSKDLPPNITLIKNFDQADNVNSRLNELGLELLIAILLVIFTLSPLGIRAASVVMISIPLSLAAGLTLLNFFHYNLNQLSIVGFVVALGLLVDDSIVVVENIERWLNEGHSRFEATIKATKQIGFAVVGCTSTLVIAFLPLLFLPETSGDFIRSLPMAVVTSVVSSMLIALTIIPFLCNHILKKKGNRENVFMRALKVFIHKIYGNILEVSLKKPIITIGIAIILFISAIYLIPVIGFSLFPASEKPQFVVNIIAPLQSNIEYTNEITKEIEKTIAGCEDVKYYATNVGKGNPMVYYNMIPERERPDFAQIFIQLKDNTSPKRKLEVIEQFRKKFKKYPYAKVEVKNFQQGQVTVAPIEIKLRGDNLDTLNLISKKIQKLLKGTEGTIYVNNPVEKNITDIRVNVNREKSEHYGILSSDIYRNIRMASAGLDLGTISQDNGDNFDIIATVLKKENGTIKQLKRLYVNTVQGYALPLRQIARFEFETSPVVISHSDKTRQVSVTSFVKKGYLVDNINHEIMDKLQSIKLPEGYSFSMGGEIESREESFGGFGKIIIITIFLFIAILLLEFKTFKSTIIVLSVIPLGIVGAVAALLVTGNTLSFVGVVGLIALAGIEVKNSILLVDFINQLRKKGKDLDTSIREAGEIRFLPIILTSLTAIFGLLPIALSTNPLISPLAIVIIGGLISSTLLSRIVTPVIYKLIPPKV